MDQAIIDLVNRFPADGEEGNLRSLLTPQHAKPLRSAAVKLKLNPQSRKSSSDNKQGYIELLVKYHRDKADGKLGQHAGPTKKKQQVQTEWRVSEHDIFLLANIVFSDAFVDRMPEADKNQTRAAPDNDAINESNPYWKDVTKAYNEEREKYKGLVAIRLQYQDVHPEKAVAHSTLKLIDMWKTLINRYAVTYKKSTSAGHTDGDFISHSNGRIDILYLHDWLQIHPNQLSKVCGSVIRQPPVSTLRQTPTSGPRQTPTSGPRQPPISTLRQPQTSIFERAIESDSSARMERSTCSKRRRDNPERQSSTEHLVNLVKNQRDEEKAMRGYEAVTRSSIAAQNALKTLQMMKDAGANEELVMQAQQKVDVVVKRWMDEMDSILLYALAALGYAALSVHSTRSLPSVRFSSFLDSVKRAFGRTKAQQQADEHALHVEILPSGESTERSLKCIGWRATGDCRPDGPRLPELDRPCTKTIPRGQSGYCELQDEDTGELFKVTRRTCADVVGKAAIFRCLEAPRFANFHVLAQEAVKRALEPGFALPNVQMNDNETQDGIVMVVYPKMVPSTYATIRVLREVLKCRLPIEIWFRSNEMRKVTAAIDPLHQLAARDSIGGVTFREIDDPLAVEFATKVFAIYHSAFDRVLFLDSDNVPVRDPSFLFQTPEFLDTGAVFWPDFWHPQHTMFYLGEDSLLWELLDLPFVDMFEQESGQLLIDRRRHAAAIELLRFFAFHRPNPFVQLKLVWGDKDLFRLAWLKLGASFHMIQRPPAVAGTAINRSFCGMTMVQHDAEGAVLFLHRNSHKLTGGKIKNPVDEKLKAMRRETPADHEDRRASSSEEYPDAAIWTHLLSFRSSSPRSEYQIQSYHAEPEFPKDQICYGQRYLDANENFYAQEFADLSFSGLETELRRFAMEAGQLHQAKVDAVAMEKHPQKRRRFRQQAASD